MHRTLFDFLAQQPSPTPCEPSVCGPNSQCRPQNGISLCSCLSSFIGSPPNCRAGCISNSECSNQLACINQKCQDPCVGSCGANADCYVVSHTPMCTCVNGYTGDPFTQCIFRERKYNIPEIETCTISTNFLYILNAHNTKNRVLRQLLSLLRINIT